MERKDGDEGDDAAAWGAAVGAGAEEDAYGLDGAVHVLEEAAARVNTALKALERDPRSREAVITARPVSSWQLRLNASCILVDILEAFTGRLLHAAERDARKAFFADHVTNVDVILLAVRGTAPALAAAYAFDDVQPQMVAAGDVRQVAAVVHAVCDLVLGDSAPVQRAAMEDAREAAAGAREADVSRDSMSHLEAVFASLPGQTPERSAASVRAEPPLFMDRDIVPPPGPLEEERRASPVAAPRERSGWSGSSSSSSHFSHSRQTPPRDAAAADLQEELARDLQMLEAYLTRTGDLSGGSMPGVHTTAASNAREYRSGSARRGASPASAAASAPSGWVSPRPATAPAPAPAPRRQHGRGSAPDDHATNEIVITFGGDGGDSDAETSRSSSESGDDLLGQRRSRSRRRHRPAPVMRRRPRTPSPSPSPPRPDPAEAERQARRAAAEAARRVRERRVADARKRAAGVRRNVSRPPSTRPWATPPRVRKAAHPSASARRKPRRASRMLGSSASGSTLGHRKQNPKQRQQPGDPRECSCGPVCGCAEARKALVREWLDAATLTDYRSGLRGDFNRHRHLDCQLDTRPLVAVAANTPAPKAPNGTEARPLVSDKVAATAKPRAVAEVTGPGDATGMLLRQHEDRVRRILLSNELRRRNAQDVGAARAWQRLLREFRQSRTEGAARRRATRESVGRRLTDVADSVEHYLRDELDLARGAADPAGMGPTLEAAQRLGSAVYS